MGVDQMTDLIQLTDLEIAAVAGGAISQSASVSAIQSNSSSVSQSATATNSGAVSASTGAGNGNTAAAAGAEANNLAVVTQVNVARASNSVRIRH
jgi:hypothetical protein